MINNEIKKEISYEEIEAIRNSAEPPSIGGIRAICDYFGMNSSSGKQIMHIHKFGVPIKTIIDALENGENRINAYGGDPRITGIAIGDKNRKYALIVFGDCGKSMDIQSVYPLNDFKPVKQIGRF
ncbi:MAG: hypothetical protein ABIF85_01435 [Nanoarchaeota archaeon]|nr:hypothetical protein [Nanoarchaeota archaeon]MBU4299758.1 hypothetical protein [Nanoarchaeota archaeon]MBU4452572.1 hypothetical protein [Nanoarchaeota archaeon]MCG2723537.1 hypothetical protein [archaeon]